MQLVISNSLQKIIDWGVLGHDVSIVWKLFLVQMSVFLGYIIFNSINTFLLTKLNFNIGIEYLSELLGKIIRLPLKYFETRLNTEFIQRFDDYLRLQSFFDRKINRTSVVNYKRVGLFCYFRLL